MSNDTKTGSLGTNMSSTKWTHIQAVFFGIFGATFALVFVTGFFRQIGFSELHIAVYGSITGFASLFCIFGTLLVWKTRRYKATVVILVTLSATFAFAAILTGAYGHSLAIIPVIVLILMTLYLLSNFLYIPLMLPWFYSFVGEKRWTGFYSTRLICMDSAVLATTVGIGFLLSKEQSLDRFVYVFCIAAVVGLLSVIILNRLPDFAVAEVSPGIKTYVKELINAIMEKKFRNLLVIATLRTFSYGLVVPFQTLYLLEYLKFEYSTITLLVGMSSLFSIIFYKVWARLQRHFGFFKCLKCTLLLSVLDPVLWLLATQGNFTSIYIVFVLFGMGGVQGIIGSGYWTSYLGALFQRADDKQKPIYNSLYFVTQGITAFIAPMLAGLVIVRFNTSPLYFSGMFSEGINGYKLVFIISGLLLTTLAVYSMRTKPIITDKEERG